MTHPVIKVLQANHLPYIVKAETLGDGNCFFRALEQQIQRPEIAASLPVRVTQAGVQHNQLRSAIVDFVDMITIHHPGFQISKDIYIERNGKPGEHPSVTWHRCCELMKSNATWAEDIFIEAAAFYLEKDIFVTSATTTREHPWNRICCHQHDQPCPSNPVTMVLINQNHFQSIWPDTSVQ